MIPDGDTWTFTSSGWTEVATPTAPAARWGAEMVYDEADGYLLMFGGRNDTQYFNDTWAYNATGWHQIPTSTAPAPRTFFGLVYDASSGDVVLFGGGNGNLPAGAGCPPCATFNDTWTYHAGVWSNITSTAGIPPTSRSFLGMGYDASTQEIVLQGGSGGEGTWHGDVGGHAPCPTLYNDTWAFTGGKWVQLNPAGAPAPSGADSIQFDSVTNTTLLFQGTSQGVSSDLDCSNYGSQVWSFSAGNWTLAVANTSSSPPSRGNPAWVDDPAAGGEILFGGVGEQTYSYLNDTWLLTASPLDVVVLPVIIAPATAPWFVSPMFLGGASALALGAVAVVWVAVRRTRTGIPPAPPAPPRQTE
ncbi:MAG: kelch repeat-containing protein [Thermoplasmata archaeon]